MSRTLKELLKKMLNQSFSYNGQVYKISEMDEENGMYKLATDKGPLVCTLAEIQTFKPVSSLDITLINSNIQNEFADCHSITAILKDTIGKVQKNKEYVAQAKSINDSVKNLIDLKRAQIDMISTMQSFR